MDKHFTFIVDANLWKQVKAEAALEGLTMQKLVDQALREKIEALRQARNK